MCTFVHNQVLHPSPAGVQYTAIPCESPSRHTLSVRLTSAIACPLLVFMISGLSVPYCCLQLCPSCVCRVPEALQLLIQLYVERNYMLWKIPEVCSLPDHVCVDGEISQKLDTILLRVQATWILLRICLYVSLYMLAGPNMAGNQCQGCGTEIQGYWPNICGAHTKVGNVFVHDSVYNVRVGLL